MIAANENTVEGMAVKIFLEEIPNPAFPLYSLTKETIQEYEHKAMVRIINKLNQPRA